MLFLTCSLFRKLKKNIFFFLSNHFLLINILSHVNYIWCKIARFIAKLFYMSQVQKWMSFAWKWPQRKWSDRFLTFLMLGKCLKVSFYQLVFLLINFILFDLKIKQKILKIFESNQIVFNNCKCRLDLSFTIQFSSHFDSDLFFSFKKSLL